MRNQWLLLLWLAVIGVSVKASALHKKLLTPAIINQPGALFGPGWQRIEWRPGRDEITYLLPESAKPKAVVSLNLYDVASGKTTMLLDSKELKPKVDLHSVEWSPKGNSLLFRKGNELWLYHVAARSWRQLADIKTGVEYPTFSPTGAWIAFVSRNNLYALSRKSGAVEQLTTDGSATVYNGKLDWVYEEELALRSTSPAFVWSPDGKEIAYLALDDGPVPVYPITHYLSTHVTLTSQRFPQAGDPNPIPSMRVVSIVSKQEWTTTLKDSSVEYISPDFDWSPDSKAVYFETLNRPQTVLKLLRWQPASGNSKAVITERDPYWINAHYPPVFVRGGRDFLWLSERDGWMHLYFYRSNGKLIRKLTDGDWMIDYPIFSDVPILEVDQRRSLVYFQSTDPDPRQRQIWRVPMAGGPMERVTREAGTHAGRLSPDGTYLVETFSDYRTPPVVRLLKANGARVAVLSTPPNHLDNYLLGAPRFVKVKASDGATLYASLLLPPNFNPREKYPVIVYVYGGPEFQVVTNQWGAWNSPLNQLFAGNGFIVWSLDNRGSWGRGHAWESVIFEHMGVHELADQLAGVDYLKSLPYVDPTRIGIWGWSYGGYMTLYSLTHAPDVFRCGAAGGPVTAWKFYDTIYTERYMRTPKENPIGYRESSPLYAADRLKAKLLLIHGTDDDNVHMQNTMNFIQALINANKPFKLYLQPGQKHGFVGQTVRTYLSERLLEFFERNLKEAH